MKSAIIKLALATTTALTVITPAIAQEATANTNGGLEEIVVTAQKREQSVQDVPIAVTAVTQETLQANRITNVNDLSSIAPGVIVKPSAGGIQVPVFTIRGQQSFGVVAGSDKQVSIYLDGVYLSSPRGSIFDLPDVARLEVLRGPQGTLFGRNATAGAVSVVTRDPSGEFGGKLEGTYGNHDQYRVRASIETPQMGPFSAYFSFVRNYKQGDIRNAGAGVVWDRSLSTEPGLNKIGRSPDYLGNVDSNSYFAAVKFESGDFKLIYKFDRNDDKGTPDGVALVAYDPKFAGLGAGAPLLAPFVNALYNNQNIYLNPSNQRPDAVSNSWVVPRQQKVYGHNLTATWRASDHITVKNTFAYRNSFVFSSSAIDGVSGLTFTPQALVPYATFLAFSSIGRDPRIPDQAAAIANIGRIAGENASKIGSQVLLIASNATSRAKQWSDELQVNYSSDDLNVTAGAIWFKSDDTSGGPEGLQNTFSLKVTPSLLALGNEGRSFNKGTSIAAYAQIEYKITPELEVVLGGRVTHDDKAGRFRYDTGGGPSTSINLTPPNYKSTLGNYLIGLNWKPNRDTLIYGKYSTSFVSGGNNTIGLNYEPETAKSFELGIKADLLDHKLRTNLAVFLVNYKNFQQPGSPVDLPSRTAVRNQLVGLYSQTVIDQLVGAASGGVINTYVLSAGDVRAKGFELEVTAAPTRGLVMGGGLGYTDTEYTRVNPFVLAANNGEYVPVSRPKWTLNVYGSYETPKFGNSDMTLQFRLDGLYRSSYFLSAKPMQDLLDPSKRIAVIDPSDFKLNGRVALKHIALGPVQAELALWGKNLANRSSFNSVLFLFPGSAVNYDPDRSYGVDLNLKF
jgi:iron complex outermembrane receptor protein